MTESQTVGTCNCTCDLTRLRKTSSRKASSLAHRPQAPFQNRQNPAAPGTQTSPLAIGPQHSNSHACLRNDLRQARLPCSIPHFTTNSVGEARPVGRWPLLGLHDAKVGFCVLGKYVAPLVSDGLSGWFATVYVGAQAKTHADQFFFALIPGFMGLHMCVWGAERGRMSD